MRRYGQFSPGKPPRLPVFVYGTLRPGEKNYPAFLLGRTVCEAAATVEGELFFVADGGYPYMTPGPGIVRGEVVFLAPGGYEETLTQLDGLEEYDPDHEANSVYLRRRTTARLADGDPVEAWIYYWNCPQVEGEKIASGDFKKR